MGQWLLFVVLYLSVVNRQAKRGDLLRGPLCVVQRRHPFFRPPLGVFEFFPGRLLVERQGFTVTDHLDAVHIDITNRALRRCIDQTAQRIADGFHGRMGRIHKDDIRFRTRGQTADVVTAEHCRPAAIAESAST